MKQDIGILGVAWKRSLRSKVVWSLKWWLACSAYYTHRSVTDSLLVTYVRVEPLHVANLSHGVLAMHCGHPRCLDYCLEMSVALMESDYWLRSAYLLCWVGRGEATGGLCYEFNLKEKLGIRLEVELCPLFCWKSNLTWGRALGVPGSTNRKLEWDYQTY